MVDSLYFIGFCFTVFCVAVTSATAVVAIIVATPMIYRLAKRGKYEEELDCRDSLRLRRDVEAR